MDCIISVFILSLLLLSWSPLPRSAIALFCDILKKRGSRWPTLCMHVVHLIKRRNCMGRLDGRVAFVTGAGRGIGAATALRMAEEGARVALADIDTEGCKQVAAELERIGSEGLVVPCNVADSAMVQNAVDTAAGH